MGDVLGQSFNDGVPIFRGPTICGFIDRPLVAPLTLYVAHYHPCSVLIIGAGKMSTLLVKHLASKGCKEVTVLNRSMPRAEALAAEFPEVKFNIHLMPDLMKCVEAADVIFAASGSEELLIHKADIEAMAPRPAVVGGVRRFVDISVPRNIAPNINELAGSAIVYNVDDLKEVSFCSFEAWLDLPESSAADGCGFSSQFVSMRIFLPACLDSVFLLGRCC